MEQAHYFRDGLASLEVTLAQTVKHIALAAPFIMLEPHILSIFFESIIDDDDDGKYFIPM